MTGGYLFVDYEKNKDNLKGKRLFSLEDFKEAEIIFKNLIERCFEET